MLDEFIPASRQSNRARMRSNHRTQRVLCHSTLPRLFEAYTFQRRAKWQDAHTSDQQFCLAAVDYCCPLQESLASRIVLQMDQAALENQEILGQQRERRQDANLVRRVDLCADCHCQEGASIHASLYTLLQILSVSVFEKTEISCAFQNTGYSSETLNTDNQLNLFASIHENKFYYPSDRK